jgi:hypothetical protein
LIEIAPLRWRGSFAHGWPHFSMRELDRRVEISWRELDRQWWRSNAGYTIDLLAFESW